MDQVELTQLLDGMIATWENEVVEFKQANDNFSTDDIGKYFSALANEANLRNAPSDKQKDNKIANLLTNLRHKGAYPQHRQLRAPGLEACRMKTRLGRNNVALNQ